MAVAEIEYPLAGAVLGASFPAGGVYDLIRNTQVPVPPGPVPFPAPVPAPGSPPAIYIRCKLLGPGGVPPLLATSSDFQIPTDPMTGQLVPSGAWSVGFSGFVGSFSGCTICSYFVTNGSEQVGEIVTNLTVSNSPQAGGTITIGLGP